MKKRIGDKLVEVENGVIKGAWAEAIHHPDGRVDVIVHVHCLQIQSKVQEKKKVEV